MDLIDQNDDISKYVDIGFERSRFENLATLRGSDVLPNSLQHIPAIVRIPGKGTATLIAKEGNVHGVLLTSAFVFHTREQAVGKTAIFFQGHPKRKPIEVGLRPERVFYSPPPPSTDNKYNPTHKLTDDWLPYCIVACDLIGTTGGNVHDVQPVSIPITTAQLQEAECTKGGTHMAVLYPSGGVNRKYHTNTIVETGDHYTAYQVAMPSDYTSFGAPWFNEKGKLAAVQHQTRDHNQGMKLTAIIRNLFDAQMFGLLQFNILDEDPALDDRFDWEGEGKGKNHDNAVIYSHLWDTWYHERSLASLVGLMYAFHYSPKMLTIALKQLSDHSQHGQLHLLATEGGIHPILHALDQHAYNEPLIESALAALGAVSAYDTNLVQMTHYDTVPIVLSCIKEFPENELVLQWAIFVILQLSRLARDNVSLALSLGALTFAVNGMKKFPNNSYIARWSIHFMGVAGETDESFLIQVHRQGGVEQLLASCNHFLTAELLIENAINSLQIFTTKSDAIISFLMEKNGIKFVSNILDIYLSNEEIIAGAIMIVYNIAKEYTEPLLLDAGMERRIYEATQHYPNSTKVMQNAISAYFALGLDPVEQFKDNELTYDLLPLTKEETEGNKK